jgi:hypothetical protein
MTAALALRPAVPTPLAPVRVPAAPRRLPSIRVVPAPRSEPPSDDELLAAGLAAPPSSAPLLPLDLPGPASRLGRVRADLSRLPVEMVGTDEPPAPPPSPARAATRLFLATCVEVIGGFRPMSQLRPLCLPDRFTEIADRLATHPATSPGGRNRTQAYRAYRSPVTGRSTGAPPRVPRASQTAPTDRAAIRRVQICDIGHTVAEVAVVLGRRDIVWAMALRFEYRRGRWLCTLVEVI